jgi:hypothetical protein
MNHMDSYLDLQLLTKGLGGVAFAFALINRIAYANINFSGSI